MDHITIRDSRPKGFFWADNELIDHLAAKVGPYALAVYIAICRYADSRNSTAQISLRQLERALGISRPSITKGISLLIDHGLILSEKRSSKVGNDRNLYTLTDLKALVNVVDHPGKPHLPPLVNDVDHPGKPDLPVIKTVFQNKESSVCESNTPQEILAAIHQSIPESIRPISPDSDITTAQDILDHGFTADDVRAFLGELYRTNAWAQDKVLGPKYVSKRIKAWRHGYKPTTANDRSGQTASAPMGTAGAPVSSAPKIKQWRVSDMRRPGDGNDRTASD